MFAKILFFGLVIFVFYYMFSKKSESFVLLPEGSWKDTCKVTKFYHPYIWADCLDDKGRVNKTFINTNTCYEFKHRDPDFKDPIHKQLHKTTYNLPHEHKLRNHDGILDCEL